MPKPGNNILATLLIAGCAKYRAVQDSGTGFRYDIRDAMRIFNAVVLICIKADISGEF